MSVLETKREDLYTVDTAVDLEGTVESVEIKNAKDEIVDRITEATPQVAIAIETVGLAMRLKALWKSLKKSFKKKK